MKDVYGIEIIDGEGKEKVMNGKYNVFSYTTGYQNEYIYPPHIEIKDNIDNYDFIIGYWCFIYSCN